MGQKHFYESAIGGRRHICVEKHICEETHIGREKHIGEDNHFQENRLHWASKFS